jgi:hypothetical protein
MLFPYNILFWGTLITSTPTIKLPIPCTPDERYPNTTGPYNPKCGPDAWCIPHEKPPQGAGANGTEGFCKAYPPICKPGEKIECGPNGICGSRGQCEISIPDTTVCTSKYGYSCRPGSRGCGKVFSMCNRCGYCVQTPPSLLELDKGRRCEPYGTFGGIECRLAEGETCNREGFCVGKN